MKMRDAAASLLAFAALAPGSAWAHCHLQYQVIGPAGLFYQVTLGPEQYLGLLPGGTTGQLGAAVSWSDERVQDIGGTIQVGLTATDLTGSVSCTAVNLNLDGPPPCTDEGGGGPPPCTPSFTVAQTAPHSFSCSSACVSYPQPHPWLANYYPPNSPAPPVSTLSPHSAIAGAPSLAVDIHGSGFVGASLVQWNGSPLTSVLVDNASLLALIPSPLLASAGTNSMTVLNPGGLSSPLAFAVLASSGPAPDPSVVTPVGTRVYPNPWMASLGAPVVTFDGMPAGSSIKIFSISGRLVKTLDAPAGAVTWDLTNSPGGAVASGYYFYLITGGGGTQRGRLALIR